jgi:hypothetical protein
VTETGPGESGEAIDGLYRISNLAGYLVYRPRALIVAE